MESLGYWVVGGSGTKERNGSIPRRGREDEFAWSAVTLVLRDACLPYVYSYLHTRENTPNGIVTGHETIDPTP